MQIVDFEERTVQVSPDVAAPECREFPFSRADADDGGRVPSVRQFSTQVEFRKCLPWDLSMSRLPQRFYAVQTQTIDPEEIIQLVREMTELHDDGSEVHWCTSIGVL